MHALLAAALSAPPVSTVTCSKGPWGYAFRCAADGAEIPGYYPVLSGVPDIVPPVAVPLLRLEDEPTIGGTGALHVVRAPILEEHWPGQMILRGIHDTTFMEYPRLASLVVVILSRSPNWLAVLTLPLQDGRLTGLTLTQRRP